MVPVTHALYKFTIVFLLNGSKCIQRSYSQKIGYPRNLVHSFCLSALSEVESELGYLIGISFLIILQNYHN